MHIAIVGNGIAGITAARTARKSDSSCRITVISSETEHFYSRTALMYVYMGHMKFSHLKPYEDSFWKKNRIDLILDHVTAADLKNKTLTLKKGELLAWDKLLIATGSTPNIPGWPGSDLRGVQCLYSYQDLELLEMNTHAPDTPPKDQRVRKSVIAGGGLIGMELAEMLLSRNISVTMIVREKSYWGNVLPREEGEIVRKHMEDHGVEFRFNEEIREIRGNASGTVASVVTVKGEEMECEFAGITTGVSPNIGVFRNTPIDQDRGILVNSKMETGHDDVYAAGDCVEMREVRAGRKKIEQVWYTGRMMGEVAGINLTGGTAEYRPGPWFNSTKFFDIEFQVYGRIDTEAAVGEDCFFWQDGKGRSLRLQFIKKNLQLTGVCSLGIRLRHEVIHAWLEKPVSTDYFLENWNRVVFDPEFSHNPVKSILRSYTIKTGRMPAPGLTEVTHES